ncbi:MAG: GNAT family N-acetyltransferase [Acidobacteriota bacterium]|nr:GNAT family N-acetyltransferase [Acidobacteriota bacterium]
MIETRLIKQRDHHAILAISESLASWFDVDARDRAIPVDLRHQKGFVALLNGVIVGFITLYVAEGRLNIGWMGVRPDTQRQGIGRRLLSCAEDFAREQGIKEVATYTLGAGVNYEPYEATRNFYFKNGACFKVT